MQTLSSPNLLLLLGTGKLHLHKPTVTHFFLEKKNYPNVAVSMLCYITAFVTKPTHRASIPVDQ